MNRVAIRVVVCAALLIVGFIAGRGYQHAHTGYHFEVRDRKSYDFPLGPIQWSYVTESVGLPFWDPGTTTLEFQHRTLYKAQRGYPDNYPYAQNIVITDNTVAWNDGEFRFQLTIDKDETRAERW